MFALPFRWGRISLNVAFGMNASPPPFFFLVWGMEPRTWSMLGKRSCTELRMQLFLNNVVEV